MYLLFSFVNHHKIADKAAVKIFLLPKGKHKLLCILMYAMKNNISLLNAVAKRSSQL